MPKQIASEVEKSLRQRIAAGEWSHDGQLPAERDIAKEYAVARNTARRAINALVDEGVISRHVGRGTFVRPADEVDMNDILQRVTGVSPTDMMTVRRLVEPQAAAIAVTMASASQSRSLDRIEAKALFRGAAAGLLRPARRYRAHAQGPRRRRRLGRHAGAYECDRDEPVRATELERPACLKAIAAIPDVAHRSCRDVRSERDAARLWFPRPASRMPHACWRAFCIAPGAGV